MILLADLDFSLPLKNPVIIFSLVLFIILFAPLALNKFKIPHIIGLIVAGIIIGPYGFNLLLRDSSIVLFGTVGLLYIMFLAGLEMDLIEFKKNWKKIIIYGFLTFILPFVFGTIASYYVLGYGLLSSILLASMFSTHTLVSYPITSRYGVNRNRAVNLTIGGTMITDILALIVLASIAGMTKEEVSSSFWITLGLSSIIFVCIVFFIFPIIIQWFFKNFDDNVSQYIFVLAIVFLASFLAEAAGVEAIIGAFFSGLVLNRFIPHTSALMNRINFVGNALFIPFFLIGVGMLVDFSVLFKGWGALKVAGVIIFVAVLTKYIAAWVTQKFFKYSTQEGNLIFGLSTSHAAATLAIILVGYNIIIGETPNGEPIRLLNEDVLNGTILLILVSCAISSFVVEKAARKLAILEENNNPQQEDETDRVLISLAYPDTVPALVEFGLMIKQHNKKSPLYALHVVEEENSMNTDFSGKKMMGKAAEIASSTDDTLIPLTRYDMSISNGIIYTIKEHNISDVVIGLHHGAKDSGYHILGPVVEKIVRRTSESIFIYKAAQPLNTLKRILVAVPPKAEYEPGFYHWFDKLYTLAKGTGLSIHFYGNADSLKRISQLNEQRIAKLQIGLNPFSDWSEFLIFSREIKKDDLFILITSRKGYLSFDNDLEKVPYQLLKFFKDNSFIILYPRQLDSGTDLETQHMDNTLLNPLPDNLDVLNKAGDYVKKIFTGSGAKKNESES